MIMKTTLPLLKIDPDFQSLIPALSTEQYEELELNIVVNGCKEPVKVWRDFILDGHNRYRICHEYDIDFTVEVIELDSKEAAIAWICNNLLHNREMPKNYRRYLIGKQYYSEKLIGAMNIAGTNQYTVDPVNKKHHSGKTSTKIGKEYHIAPTTVNKFLQFVKALDRLKIEFPDFVNGVLYEKIKISQDNLIALAKKPKKTASPIVEKAAENKRVTDTDMTLPLVHKETAPLPVVSKGTVKDMPAFDPDAYVSSLALTIPSWISSMKRAAANSDLNLLSLKARYDLIGALDNLISISTIIKNVLEDD